MTKILDCPFIDQREKYPNGCESVSAVMLLRYLGFDASPDDFIDRCLPTAPAPVERDGVWYGADPQYVYPGDPRDDSGWGCFAPALSRGLRTYLDGCETYEVRELYGQTLDVLCRNYIDRGLPVIVFATMAMAEPYPYRTWLLPETGEPYTWMAPMHCLLLVGYGEGTYIFNDPLADKNTAYPSEKAARAHHRMGTQAVVVVPVK
ncbi:MAG: C39 family peptidase [Eubacteriales bacterium]